MNDYFEYEGNDYRRDIEKQLMPKNLKVTFDDYRKQFGKDFTIDHMIKIMDVYAKGVIASAIMNAPENLMHNVGKLEKEGFSISGSIRSITDKVIYGDEIPDEFPDMLKGDRNA